jgi:hypothetical protein
MSSRLERAAGDAALTRGRPLSTPAIGTLLQLRARPNLLVSHRALASLGCGAAQRQTGSVMRRPGAGSASAHARLPMSGPAASGEPSLPLAPRPAAGLVTRGARRLRGSRKYLG